MIHSTGRRIAFRSSLQFDCPVPFQDFIALPMKRFLDYHVRKAEHLAWRTRDSEAIILDLREVAYFTLNDVAARVWECADGSRTIEEIIAIISLEYEGDREQMQSDIAVLLGELADKQLVEFSLFSFT
jgi:hypothetical protein